MPKFRVQAAHYMREYITLDIQAESRAEVEAKRSDIYAVACELPDWHLDGDAGPNEGTVHFLDPEEDGEPYHESRPDAELAIQAGGEVTITDAGGPPNRAKIKEVLERHASKCLDNDEERELVLKEILEVIA
jgi:hypothetical protein